MEEEMLKQAYIVLELEPQSLPELEAVSGTVRAIGAHSINLDKSVEFVIDQVKFIFNRGSGKRDQVIALALAQYLRPEVEAGLVTFSELQTFVAVFRTRIEEKIKQEWNW